MGLVSEGCEGRLVGRKCGLAAGREWKRSLPWLQPALPCPATLFAPPPLLQTPLRAPHPSPPHHPPLLPSSPISARCNVSPLPLLTRWSSLTFSTYGLASLQLRTSNILHQPACKNSLIIKTDQGKGSNFYLRLICCIFQTMFSHHVALSSRFHLPSQ